MATAPMRRSKKSVPSAFVIAVLPLAKKECARNAALRGLVKEVPDPLVAEMLGYSCQVTQKHAAATAEPWPRYPRILATRIMTDTIEVD
jgi:hypothetical protein